MTNQSIFGPVACAFRHVIAGAIDRTVTSAVAVAVAEPTHFTVGDPVSGAVYEAVHVAIHTAVSEVVGSTPLSGGET